MICPRCRTDDDSWRRVQPRRVMVDGRRHLLMQHICGEIVAVPVAGDKIIAVVVAEELLG